MNTLNTILLWLYRICAGVGFYRICEGVAPLRFSENVIHVIQLNRTNISQINWNPKVVDVLYKLIYFYSKLQLICGKVNKRLSAMLLVITNNSSKILHKYNILTKSKPLHQLDFYNTGHLIGSKRFNNELKLTIDTLLKTELEDTFSNHYNFIIYSDLTSSNKVLYQCIPTVVDYEVSNVKFIGLILFL